MTEQIRPEQRPGSLERFLGGSPAGVAFRLVLVSLVVGFLMNVFGLDVHAIVQGTLRLVQETLRDGAGVLRSIAGYVLTGAAIVVPIWFIIRLTKAR